MAESPKRLIQITCPKGHHITPAVTREELAEACRTKRFEYFCVYCGQNWAAPPEVSEGLPAMLAQWH
jgi:hypothetical protein